MSDPQNAGARRTQIPGEVVACKVVSRVILGARTAIASAVKVDAWWVADRGLMEPHSFGLWSVSNSIAGASKAFEFPWAMSSRGY